MIISGVPRKCWENDGGHTRLWTHRGVPLWTHHDYGPTIFPRLWTHLLFSKYTHELFRACAATRPTSTIYKQEQFDSSKKNLYSYKEDTTLTKIYFLRNSRHTYARMKLNDFFIKSLMYYWQRLIVKLLLFLLLERSLLLLLVPFSSSSDGTASSAASATLFLSDGSASSAALAILLRGMGQLL